MGSVYLGRSAGGRTVAVKVVRRQFATDEDFRARFRREVLAVRAVSGAFTASVVDADTDAEVPWLATAFIPGVPLSAAVRRHGPFGEQVLRALAHGLAEALVDIHRAGVVHRDLKPANVMLAADGPHVIDFGISRAAEGTALTSTGLVIGSPGFLSPEQVTGETVGPPTDVFALGATLAFAALGTGPFGTGPTPALLYRVTTLEPDLSGLPASLRQAVEACLLKDPARRPSPDQIIAYLSRGPASDPGAGWLPAPLLADIAAAGAVLTGAPPADVDATRRSSVDSPPPSPSWSDPPPARTGSHRAGSQPASSRSELFDKPEPGRQSKLSRRAMIGLVGGGVAAIAGGTAAVVALTGGGSGGGGAANAGATTPVSPLGGATSVETSAPVATGEPQPASGGLTGTLAGPPATPVWTASLDDSVYNMTFGGGTLVVVCTNSTKGLDPASGRPRWRGVVDMGSGTISDIPLISGGVAYVTGQNSRGERGLLAVDAATGATRWSLLSPHDSWQLQAVAGIIGTTAYVTANPIIDIRTSALWAVDIATHRTVFAVTGGYLGSAVVPPSGPLLFGINSESANGVVSGVSSRTGARVWSRSFDGLVSGGPGSATGTYAAGQVYVGGRALNALKPANGAPARPAVSFDTMDLYNWPITDGAGRVFVTANGTLYAVRAADGVMLWKTKGVNYFSVDSAIVAADGMVYVIDGKGGLFALDASNGACRWSYRNPTTSAGADVALAAGGGRVYYGTGQGVLAFKAK